MRQQEQIAKGKMIEITEEFDITPERLFKAGTNEKDLTGWFAPEGFETTFCKLDVSVGANWKICIVG
jgi:uncharacterized protein YndB with AHSA1/START domain